MNSTAAWPDNPVLVEAWRSGFLESVHRGSLVVLGADGAVLAAFGAVDRPVLPRSSNKPVQATAMLAALSAGGHLRVGMEDTLTYAPGEPVRDNAQLVARAAGLARIAQRPPLTTDQARDLLGIARTTVLESAP